MTWVHLFGFKLRSSHHHLHRVLRDHALTMCIADLVGLNPQVPTAEAVGCSSMRPSDRAGRVPLEFETHAATVNGWFTVEVAHVLQFDRGLPRLDRERASRLVGPPLPQT